jgi:sodium transport system permease protein
MNAIGRVFRKEAIENLRDRRTVINALIMGPLLGPVLLVGLLSMELRREIQRAEKPLDLPVVGAEHAPTLVAFLGGRNIEVGPAPSDPEKAVRDQDEEVILRIEEEFGSAWQAGDPAPVEIIFDASRRDSQGPVGRVRDALETYDRQVGALRLLARGLSPSIVRPIAVVERDQSTAASRSGLFLGFLPYMLIIGAFVGGMYLAIDTTAGERERQSLEPLLANPVPRWQIMAGKLAATSAFATASLVLTLVAFAALMPLLPIARLGIRLSFGLRTCLLALLITLPLVILASAVQTILAAYARTYREAQSYLGILILVPMIPSVLLMVIPVKQQVWMMAVPLLSQHLLLMKLVRGETLMPAECALAIATGLLLAAIASWIAARLYRRESLAVSA